LNEKIIQSLSNKIWITRKCRINTSERLIFLNVISQLFLNYFTLVILSISIWTLYIDSESKNLTFTTVIASLFLFACTIGINSLDYKERIRKLKTCYIKLEVLYYDLEVLKSDFQEKGQNDSYEKFYEIKRSYINLLKSVENHSSYDYLKFTLTQKEYRSWKTFIKYYLLNFLFFLTIILLMLLPFFPILLMYKGWL